MPAALVVVLPLLSNMQNPLALLAASQQVYCTHLKLMGCHGCTEGQDTGGGGRAAG